MGVTFARIENRVRLTYDGTNGAVHYLPSDCAVYAKWRPTGGVVIISPNARGETPENNRDREDLYVIDIADLNGSPVGDIFVKAAWLNDNFFYGPDTESALVKEAHDAVVYTRVPSGPALGLVATKVYKVGGASGTTVATITYNYDGNGDLQSKVKT